MMRKTKKFLAIFMSSTMILTSFQNTGFNVWAARTEGESNVFSKKTIDSQTYGYLSLNKQMNEQAQVDPKESSIMEEIFSEATKVEADSESVDADLPSALDLSQTEYFPAIGDQGSTGSCGYYSIFYTNMTYVYNQAKGVKTTESNTINPMFGYNFLGIMEENSYKLIQQIGFPTIGALPLEQSNNKTLYPVKEVWESALNHRAIEIETISNYGDEDDVITGPTDPTLNQIKQTFNQIKQTLKNGLLMGTGTLTTSWNFSVVASGEHKGEVAIDRCDGNYGGGHSISIVGYDDTR